MHGALRVCVTIRGRGGKLACLAGPAVSMTSRMSCRYGDLSPSPAQIRIKNNRNISKTQNQRGTTANYNDLYSQKSFSVPKRAPGHRGLAKPGSYMVGIFWRWDIGPEPFGAYHDCKVIPKNKSILLPFTLSMLQKVPKNDRNH